MCKCVEYLKLVNYDEVKSSSLYGLDFSICFQVYVKVDRKIIWNTEAIIHYYRYKVMKITF